ncbi:hypothetical protein HanIR_Chr06g0297791 [Helianthus annuus]|nr:hypothetical protein HanIR_Chr06g0297791 [Helianthus annuus]
MLVKPFSQRQDVLRHGNLVLQPQWSLPSPHLLPIQTTHLLPTVTTLHIGPMAQGVTPAHAMITIDQPSPTTTTAVTAAHLPTTRPNGLMRPNHPLTVCTPMAHRLFGLHLLPTAPPPPTLSLPKTRMSSTMGRKAANSLHESNHLNQYGPRSAQAYLTEVDPLQPTQHIDAVHALSLDTTENDPWNFDTGAEAHVTNDQGKLTTFSSNSPVASILVGNGNKLPVIGSGSTIINTPSKLLHLKSVLFNPKIIKNLISMRKFNTDNYTSIEFDPFRFSVKDFKDGMILSRHNSTSNLYPLTTNAPATACFFSTQESSS